MAATPFLIQLLLLAGVVVGHILTQQQLLRLALVLVVVLVGVGLWGSLHQVRLLLILADQETHHPFPPHKVITAGATTRQMVS
jgi:hypothetical protein